MAALPNISLLLSDEWKEFWSETNNTVLEEFPKMSPPLQNQHLTQFVMHHIPGMDVIPCVSKIVAFIVKKLMQ